MLGRITNEQFRMLYAEYNNEQNSLKELIPQAVEWIKKLQVSITNISRFTLCPYGHEHNTLEPFFISQWCRRRDSNPHGFPHDFESCASAIPPLRLLAT